MTIDFTRIKGRYVVFSENNDRHPTIFGPVENTEIAGDTLILTTQPQDYTAYADIDENDNSNEIIFITQYLWRAILFREYNKLK